MKKLFLWVSFLLMTMLLQKINAIPSSIPEFQEVWAYVMRGEESWIKKTHPITDLAYFSAKVNDIGRIPSFPQPDKVRPLLPLNARVHCVISAPYNRSLMYWCLTKDTETRQNLLNDIIKIAASFDGIQIDFESVRPEDKDSFIHFLEEVKKKLPQGKILSITLPSKTRNTPNAYNYQKIGEIADKVIIMAYDEHTLSGAPGAIASLKWCQRVCAYAKSVIAPHKIIMGIPLYGRVWQKQPVAKSLKYFQTLDLWKKHSSIVNRQEDGTPFFSYQQTIDAIVYFEDKKSLKNKLCYYEQQKIPAVAFWRVSQEPAALWKSVHIQK